MTLFGVNLDGQQIFSLISLLSILALWLVVLKRQKRFEKWTKLRQRETPSVAKKDKPTGPWG